MAAEKDHIALANANHRALLHLLASAPEYPEWVTIIAFYKAVQIAEAVIRNQNRRSSTSSHQQRLERLKRGSLANTPALYKNYRALWNLSMIARYLADDGGVEYRNFTDTVPAESVVDEVIKKRLVPFEQASLPFLSSDGKGALVTTNPR